MRDMTHSHTWHDSFDSRGLIDSQMCDATHMKESCLTCEYACLDDGLMSVCFCLWGVNTRCSHVGPQNESRAMWGVLVISCVT